MALFTRRKITDENGDEAEMSFVDHLEELRWHLVRSAIAIVIGAIVVFIYIDKVADLVIFGPLRKDFVTYDWLCMKSQQWGLGNGLCLPPPDVKLQTTGFSTMFTTSITLSLVLGFVVAFPYVFWEFWRFIKPALREKELKSTRGAIGFVTFFFLTGIAFGYFLLAPFTFSFLANYKIGAQQIIDVKPTFDDYFDNLVDITLGSGLAFQLPVLSYVLTRIGLVTPKFLREYRKYAYVALLVIAAVITPSPDITSQLVVVLPLIGLYEFSIVVSKRTYKTVKKKAEEWS